MFDAFPPPVPPLPKPHSGRTTPTRTPEPPDVFASPTPPSGPSIAQKTLPMIQKKDQETPIEDGDDQSLVVVQQRVRSPSPTATVTNSPAKPINPAVARRKRRSMSVSDVETAKGLAPALPPIRRSNEGKKSEESFLNIITDFKGELSQFESISTKPLDLMDPSTSVRRPALARSHSDNGSPSARTERPHPKSSASLPITQDSTMTPTVTLQSATGAEESILDAVLSSPSSSVTSPNDGSGSGSGNGNGGGGIPRASSLHTPVRSRSGSGNSGQQRVSALRYGPRSPLTRNGVGHASSPSRETNRLRVQHRSTASSSEPSLIPTDRDGGRVCEYLLLLLLVIL